MPPTTPSLPLPHALEAYPDAAPDTALNLLFIHHSVGGQLLADVGPEEATPDARRSLHRLHPNGGGLRTRLTGLGYVVNEASYGSGIGQKTDLFDWLPKFQDSMSRILATRWQDELLPTGKNRVVMFKSCYPNNAFHPDPGPGESRAAGLTVARAKASFAALREVLERQAETLFVYLTAPPLRDDSDTEPRWKTAAKRILGRPTLAEERRRSAALAREFNDWITSPDGWLAGHTRRNIVAFDYFGLLTGSLSPSSGSNFLQFASRDGTDNHPHAEAQSRAATRLASFLNRAVRYAGLSR